MKTAAKSVKGLPGSTCARSRRGRAARVVAVCGFAVSMVVATGAPGAGAAPAATAAVVDPSTVNVVQNGSFETGGATLSPWIFRHDVAATLAPSGDAVDGTRAATVHIAATSPSSYRVQLRQEHIRLQGANAYTLSFWAKASTPRLIDARLQGSLAPFPTLIARNYLVTATWQQFTLTYTAKTEVADAFVGFNLAQATGDVEIDNVSLTSNNLVVNGGFETGGATLAPWIRRNDIDATLGRDTTTVLDGTASAKITVPTLGAATHQVQLRQPIASAVAGANYRVSFTIKASRARVANVRLQSSDAPYPTVVSTNFSVTTTSKRFTFTWTPKVTVNNPFLGFNLAQDTGTIWLDDITLTREPPGVVVGWGQNEAGQTTPPAGLTGVVAVAAADLHSLALKRDGTVVGWGDNSSGQATPPAGLTGVTAIATGIMYSLALKSDGTVVAWGDINLPVGIPGASIPPPTGLTGVVAIAVGGFHALALKSDGTLVGWGWNLYGQASPPSGLTDVVSIGAGFGHSLAVKRDGTVVGWGVATPPAGLNGFTAVAANATGNHSLGLRSDGTVVGWGDDEFGQSTPPVGLSGVTVIATASTFSLALKGDGTVVGWGRDPNGADHPPAGLTGVTAIAAGSFFGLAVVAVGPGP
jgi:Carbohydrate binding domain/Regulator of chromosome condensation (RCC1) repeat